jgi:hypothetical protein
MQVLRHGNTHKEVECGECGALLSYCKEDIETFYGGLYNYNSVQHSTVKNIIKCPECHNYIVLDYFVDGIKTEYPYISMR